MLFTYVTNLIVDRVYIVSRCKSECANPSEQNSLSKCTCFCEYSKHKCDSDTSFSTKYIHIMKERKHFSLFFFFFVTRYTPSKNYLSLATSISSKNSTSSYCEKGKVSDDLSILLISRTTV